MMGVVSLFRITPIPTCQIHKNSDVCEDGVRGGVGRQNDPEYCLVLGSGGHASSETACESHLDLSSCRLTCWVRVHLSGHLAWDGLSLLVWWDWFFQLEEGSVRNWQGQRVLCKCPGSALGMERPVFPKTRRDWQLPISWAG